MTIRLMLAPASATIALSEKAAARSPQFELLVESLMKRTFNPNLRLRPGGTRRACQPQAAL